MTRTAIRHSLSALAAAALVLALMNSPVSAKSSRVGHGLGLDHTLTNKETGVTPKGLATNTPSQQTKTTHYPLRWWQDYGN